MSLKVEQVIDKPVSQVFRFVATEHFSNHPRWDPAWVEMIPTSPGPVRTGATVRVVRVEHNQRLEGSATVTLYEPDRAFAAVLRFGPFVLQQRVLLHRLAERSTHLALTIDTTARGVMGLLLHVMRWRFRSNMTRSLGTIKRLVEAEAGSSPGAWCLTADA